MKKINYCIVYPTSISDRKIGGIETAIKNIIESAPENFNIYLVGVKEEDENYTLGQWNDAVICGKSVKFMPIMNVQNINKRTLIPMTLKYSLNVRKYKKEINFPDKIIVLHRIEPFFPIFMEKSNKILFVHGNILNFKNSNCESKWRYFHTIYYKLEPYLIKKFNYIFVVSKDGLSYYQDTYKDIKDRFIFFPTWYNPKIFKTLPVDREKLLTKYKINTGADLVLYVGRLEKAKNPEMLINSFYELQLIRENVVLLMIGDGSLRAQVDKQITALQIQDKVFIIGPQKQPEIAEIMNVASCLVLTSEFEGMSRVILESLACGLPVVSTEVGETYYLDDHPDISKVVKAWDAKKISASLDELLSKRPAPEQCKEIVAEYMQTNVLNSLFTRVEAITK